MTTRADVVVVGAGAMGSAAAWRLAAAGRDVVLLEQFEAGHDRGSSHGATRIFRVAYRDPLYVGLARRAVPLWRELEDVSGQVLLEQVGQLDHGHHVAMDEIAANLSAAGYGSERLTASAAAERWPGMRFDRQVVFSPDGGRCWAERTVDAAWRAAAAAGAEVRFSTPVEQVEVGTDSAVVHTSHGAWESPVVVVAAGAWATRVLGGALALDLGLPPLEVVAEQPSHFRPLDPAAQWPSFLHHVPGPGGAEDRLAFDAYGLLTPGEGVKVGGHGSSVPVDPDHRPGLDPALTANLVRYVQEWFPGLDPDPVSTTSCLFTSTPDEHFVLDRRGPVVVCSPCSGHGFKFVPAIGAEVAALAMGGPQVAPAWRLGAS